MDISLVVDYLNFWINKKTGAFFTIEECTSILDQGQLALFRDLRPKYATSQDVKDILSPFKSTYNFTAANTISGTIVVPSNSNYLDLMDIQIYYQISDRTIYWGVQIVNEDERANMLNSQLNPVTVTSPIGEQMAPRYFKLYPTAGYNGTVSFFIRPPAPVYAYTTVSGRVIVYDPVNSVQLAWRDTEINSIVLKALQVAGINLSDDELAQFAEIKSRGNYSLYTGVASNQDRL